MSIEAHPNIHAVGLTVDIIDAIQRRVRGKAALLSQAKVMDATNNELQAFITRISVLLDQAAR
jgi:hypothetical protein